MRFSNIVIALVACMVSSAVADSSMYGVPLYKRDHPADSKMDKKMDSSNSSSGISVVDNYSPTPENFAMDDWVCIEDNGMDDPAWRDLDCMDDTEDDWECDYDPIPPPNNPGTPSNPSTPGTPIVPSQVSPVNTPNTNINVNSAKSSQHKSFVAVAVAVAAVALSL
ncbi:hypothetical protein HDU97_005592 [Phlyctochytrium planicorne]|nr:hypothetical protein HDU97_005592 [Phlyctochytrium planicorne]